MRLLGLLAVVIFPAMGMGGQGAPQIGGGVCSAASLNGNYSILLSAAQSMTEGAESTGIANFDGVSTATFTVATGGVQSILSGSYAINTDCTGSIALISGSFANLALAIYGSGSHFEVTGEDGTYLYAGGGSILPATCNAAMLSGGYGFGGAAAPVGVAGAVVGTAQFDGRRSVSLAWSVAATGAITKVTASGSYFVTPSCVANAAVVDAAGNSYSVEMTVVSGNAFVLSVAGPAMAFGGNAKAIETPEGCTEATLNGVRTIALNGINEAAATGLAGTATFDGTSRAAFSLPGSALLGNYSIGADCTGTMSISVGGSGNYALIVFDNGSDILFAGEDGTFVYSGSAATPPATCISATLSGAYAFEAAGTMIGNPMNISGLLTFDGRGGVRGEWTAGGALAGSPETATGEYSISSACQGAATMLDPNGTAYTANFVMSAADGSSLAIDLSSSLGAFGGQGQATFRPPGMTIVNGASFAAGGTPAGSEFVLFGNQLTAGGSAQSGKPPLPKSLMNTSVTVNGETAPLYFVSATQLNAQMPVDVQPGPATVAVTVGGVESNSAAVVVPATASPGIYFYNANRGVFQNPDYSLNSPTTPAHAGDVVVAWFTGGGPVNAAGALVSGAGSPIGLSPVTEESAIRIGGLPATIDYIGLAPGMVGVYQANFVVPEVPAGNQTVVIRIGGVDSQGELITVAN